MSCSAIWYCGFVPVPLSPMTANLSESFWFGSVICGAAAETTAHNRASGMTTCDRRRACMAGFPPLGNDIRCEIDDRVRARVAQNQMLADEPVFDVGGQLRQPCEHLG